MASSDDLLRKRWRRHRLGHAAKDMADDFLCEIIYLRNNLVHRGALGVNVYHGFAGGDVRQFRVDAEAVADLGDAAPDQEIRA